MLLKICIYIVKNVCFFSFSIYLFGGTHMGVRGQHVGIVSLPTVWFPEVISGCQIWQQAPLPAEPYHWPKLLKDDFEIFVALVCFYFYNSSYILEMNAFSLLNMYFHTSMLNQAYITFLEKYFLRPRIAT